HDLRRGRARRHAPADPPDVRAEGADPAAAAAGRHAPLLRGRHRAAADRAAAHERARPQPRRRRARAAARGRAAQGARAGRAPAAAAPPGSGKRPQAVPPRPRRLPRGAAAGKEVMDFSKLTIKSQEAVAAAQELARRNGNPELYPEHLLLALLDQELPRELVPDAEALRAQAEAALAQKPRIEGAQQQPGVSAAFSKVLDRAADEAKKLEDEYVASQHLLLALDVVPRKELLAKIAEVTAGRRVTSQDPEGTYQALSKFGRDLTEAAESGRLDPVIGRDEEIRR